MIYLPTPESHSRRIQRETPGVRNRHTRHLLQHDLVVRLSEPIPVVQAVAGLDAQRLVPLLDDLAHLPRTQVLGLAAARRVPLDEVVVVSADAHERLHRGRCFAAAAAAAAAIAATAADQRMRVAKLGQRFAVLDELVDEVVVARCVWEKAFALGQGEGCHFDEGRD